jgi:hypothetical protein
VLDFVIDIALPLELEFRVLDFVTDIALRWSWKLITFSGNFF